MCSFMVTVNDTQPPVFPNGCPAGINLAVQVSCPFATSSMVNYTKPVATDNCPPPPTVVCIPPSGSMFPVGTTMVTCTATGSSGNTATCSFPVKLFSFCLQDDSSDGTWCERGDWRIPVLQERSAGRERDWDAGGARVQLPDGPHEGRPSGSHPGSHDSEQRHRFGHGLHTEAGRRIHNTDHRQEDEQ